jgi:diguanylate cyclase (GGDEF)-like protein/PAS domain S-box-containing protein
MLKVRSLKSTIILQFAVIITPITLVLVYQAVSDVRHASSVRFGLQSVALALQARDNYKVFLNGVADAVDTGSLSNRARQALEQTKESLVALQSWDRSFQSGAVLAPIDTLLETTRRNPSLKELLPLRETTNRVNGLLTTILESYEAREHQNTENVTRQVRQQLWIVMTAMCITVASAIGFLVLLIRGLTEPLNRAVTLATEIASGDFRAEKSMDTGRDIGGLLASLAAMRNGLRRAFSDLAKNEALLANAQRIAQIGSWEMDLADLDDISRNPVRWSNEVFRILGLEPGKTAASNENFIAAVHPDDRERIREEIAGAINHGRNYSIEHRISRPDGSERVVHEMSEIIYDSATGDPIRMVGTVQDVTERKRSEQLAYLAQFDTLTGLPNRHMLHDQLNQTLAQAQRVGGRFGCMFVDLDRFKHVNDTFGHNVGDKLLIQVAQRLRQCLRTADIVGRLGGDEFAVVLASLAKASDAGLVAGKVISALSAPFDLDRHETYISASIGISIYPGDGDEVDALLKNADTAMYRAKDQGRNNYQFYLPQMNERAGQRMQLETALHGALEREEFLLHYQPKVELVHGAISGLEALLRWQHPERGLILPAHFVPVLEDTGLIVPVGEWVLQAVCGQIKAWQAQGITPPPISINVSARQFQQRTLNAFIERIREAGIDPSLVVLELTESLLMKDALETVRMLTSVKASGVRLSVDDFGTGYSSLAYLKRFPLDELKVDRIFVSDVTTDPDGAEIILAIISLARSLKLKVVAEGVETEGQLRFLCAHGCDEMQGYYFSRPMTVFDCTRALMEGRRLKIPVADESSNDTPLVLFVDDNQIDVEFMQKALEPEGYRILSANSPQAALELLATHTVSIVISDQNMPAMTGVKFLSVVRKLYPRAIRIVVSGVSDTGTMTNAVNEAGIHKFLSKSWDSARLRSEVREAYLHHHDQPT